MSTTKNRKSLLRGSDAYVAQTVEITVAGDVYRFDIRELSAAATKAIDDWAEITAAQLGCDAALFENGEALGEWLSEHGTETDENGQKISDLFQQCLESLWDISLNDALAGWDLDEPFNAENRALLPKVIKRQLHELIRGGSSLGVGADQFFRGRIAARHRR